MTLVMGKERLCTVTQQIITQKYAWEIKSFPLERTERSLIYDNPKIQGV